MYAQVAAQGTDPVAGYLGRWQRGLDGQSLLIRAIRQQVKGQLPHLALCGFGQNSKLRILVGGL